MSRLQLGLLLSVLPAALVSAPASQHATALSARPGADLSGECFHLTAAAPGAAVVLHSPHHHCHYHCLQLEQHSLLEDGGVTVVRSLSSVSHQRCLLSLNACVWQPACAAKASGNFDSGSPTLPHWGPKQAPYVYNAQCTPAVVGSEKADPSEPFSRAQMFVGRSTKRAVQQKL